MSKGITTPDKVTLQTPAKEMLLFLKKWVKENEVLEIQVHLEEKKDAFSGDSFIALRYIEYQDLV